MQEALNIPCQPSQRVVERPGSTEQLWACTIKDEEELQKQ
uniref:Uncharacterized protein n=1 Tax=Anguilla anguilla TaxID=7936 RepID=A0A0E9T578_ANGAN